MPFDAYFLKRGLQQSKVSQEFIVIFSLPVDFGQGNLSGGNGIN
jgi:hypothetical protein